MEGGEDGQTTFNKEHLEEWIGKIEQDGLEVDVE